MKGQKFLKVTSIIMIVLGVLGVITGIFGFLGVGALSMAGLIENATLLYVSFVIVIVASIIELIAGIKGVGACNAPEKAGACVKFGIIIAVLSIVSTILGAVAGSEFNATTIVSLLLNLVLPGLYSYGALQMKNEANA